MKRDAERLIYLARLVGRAHRGLHHLLQSHWERTGENLSLTEIMVVRLVNEVGSLRATQLSAQLGIPPSTMTSILDRLEARDLVRRVRNKNDRRAVMVELRPGATKNKQQLEKILGQELGRVLGEVSPERLEMMIDNLEFLAEKLQPKR